MGVGFFAPIRSETFGGLGPETLRGFGMFMLFLDLTLPTAAEDLALDEALMETAASDSVGVLRIWERPDWCVVVGRSSRVQDEVHLEICRQAGVPVLRRASGGAAVLLGGGCLIYTLIAPRVGFPLSHQIEAIHECVLGRIVEALRTQLPEIDRQGISDIAYQDRKFSGNSLRIKQQAVLYHGTILYNFAIDRVRDFLRLPPRQPAWRRNRDHDEFLTNLPLPRELIIQALRSAWHAWESLEDWPREKVRRLVHEVYGQDEWNFAR